MRKRTYENAYTQLQIGKRLYGSKNQKCKLSNDFLPLIYSIFKNMSNKWDYYDYLQKIYNLNEYSLSDYLDKSSKKPVLSEIKAGLKN